MYIEAGEAFANERRYDAALEMAAKAGASPIKNPSLNVRLTRLRERATAELAAAQRAVPPPRGRAGAGSDRTRPGQPGRRAGGGRDRLAPGGSPARRNLIASACGRLGRLKPGRRVAGRRARSPRFRRRPPLPERGSASRRIEAWGRGPRRLGGSPPLAELSGTAALADARPAPRAARRGAAGAAAVPRRAARGQGRRAGRRRLTGPPPAIAPALTGRASARTPPPPPLPPRAASSGPTISAVPKSPVPIPTLAAGGGRARRRPARPRLPGGGGLDHLAGRRQPRVRPRDHRPPAPARGRPTPPSTRSRCITSSCARPPSSTTTSPPAPTWPPPTPAA